MSNTYELKFDPPADFATQQQGFRTGLQVASDPGVWVVYTGFILLIAGCFITFFMSHQQVCVELVPTASGSRVMLAGKALKGQVAMEQKLNRLAEELRGA